MTQTIEAMGLAADLTVAWLNNPNTRTTIDDVPAFMKSVHAALLQLHQANDAALPSPSAEAAQPATSVRKSLASPDHIVSMIDGKPYRTLRRHLKSHGLTPEEYRARYNLRSDYPMVAPAYSEARRALSKSLGLGGRVRARVEEAVPSTEDTLVEPETAAMEASADADSNDPERDPEEKAA